MSKSLLAAAVIAAGTLASADEPIISAAGQSGFDGFYAGIGLGVMHTDFSRNACCPGPVGYRADALATVNVGYNWVLGPALAGVELDYSLTRVSAAQNAAFGFGPVDQDQAASVRLRLGVFTSPGTAIYGTAGTGWMHMKVPGDSKWVQAPVYGLGIETEELSKFVGLGPDWRFKGEAIWQGIDETRLVQGGTPLFSSSENSFFRLGINKSF